MSLRTRFAPSPTGFLHIGGVRTALFNWLLARHHGGQFILRIDDTDQQRHVEDAVSESSTAFAGSGIDWDEGPEVGGPFGPYYQSQRADRYRAGGRATARVGPRLPRLQHRSRARRRQDRGRSAKSAPIGSVASRSPTRGGPVREPRVDPTPCGSRSRRAALSSCTT